MMTWLGLHFLAQIYSNCMTKTRTKICGITRPQDALAAAEAGADAIGLVFFSASPRYVNVAQALDISATLPPFVSKVGLFVNAPATEVRTILERVPLDLLQFHGDERPDFCKQFNKPYIKAINVKAGMDLLQYASLYSEASGLLFDSFLNDSPGGTGITFNWALIPAKLSLPVILSGGLNPENVAAAVRQVRPWAVDVSSGVERAKGIKDAQKIAAFITEVRSAEL